MKRPINTSHLRRNKIIAFVCAALAIFLLSATPKQLKANHTVAYNLTTK